MQSPHDKHVIPRWPNESKCEENRHTEKQNRSKQNTPGYGAWEYICANASNRSYCLDVEREYGVRKWGKWLILLLDQQATCQIFLYTKKPGCPCPHAVTQWDQTDVDLRTRSHERHGATRVEAELSLVTASLFHKLSWTLCAGFCFASTIISFYSHGLLGLIILHIAYTISNFFN